MKVEDYKEEIRQLMKEKRRNLKLDEKNNKDSIIFEKLISCNTFKECKTVFIYVSYGSEVNTHEIIKYALKQGKKVCVPRVISKKDGMKSLIINSFNELKIGSYGILEPQSENVEITSNSIDLAILPGLAFDLKGGRIGYGGAFYDRYFQNNSHAYKIALAYDFQIIENISTDENDIPVDGVITESNFYSFAV